MSSKWIGAICIIVSCGGCGLSAAAASIRETHMLQDLLKAVRLMECELQYKLSPLPDLCRQAGLDTTGTIREVFMNLARELDWQIKPDVRSCMLEAIEKSQAMPGRVQNLFCQLGDSLGRFDLSGQLKELQCLRTTCERELQKVTFHQDTRLRSYRTLGLCAGIALAILLL